MAFRLFFFGGIPRTNPGWRIGGEWNEPKRRVQEIKGTAEEEILRAFMQEGGFRVGLELRCGAGGFVEWGKVGLFGEKKHNKFLYV